MGSVICRETVVVAKVYVLLRVQRAPAPHADITGLKMMLFITHKRRTTKKLEKNECVQKKGCKKSEVSQQFSVLSVFAASHELRLYPLFHCVRVRVCVCASVIS